jgi:putative Ca2+/H+ antiporter (TMEM165/GDT1 family)
MLVAFGLYPVGAYQVDAFITSLLTVSLAEMGDKTQILSLFLATRFNKPWPIIAGILVATILNHGASAFLGEWLSHYLTSDTGKWIIGGCFIVVGLWLLVPDKEDQPSNNMDKYGAFVVSCVLFFLAEIGDKTQIATVLLGAQFHSVVIVTIGTTLGMLLANVPVVFLGNKIMQRIPLNITRSVAAMVFIVMGILILVR